MSSPATVSPAVPVSEETEALPVQPGDFSEPPPPPSASGEDDGAPTFDAAAESAFLAEARERSEVVASPRRADAPEPEEADPKALPPLDTLVKRISPEVRELLDELFRVKFVRVTRVPRKALKS